ncbi:MAG TPA: MlaD family protein [Streptosporangiaceae bacterium]|nr:MlaD family protein [Streptosporangiaceae bacterium]
MRNRVAGLVATAVAVLALVLVFHPPQLPWQHEFRFQISSPAFSQLQPGATVELAGQRVGQLDSLTVQHGLPLLNVQVDSADAHLLHSDATASIQPHGLLGTQYIELNGGSRGTMQAGGVIPASRVHVAVTLDQVLDVFQNTERQNLQTVINQLGVASANRGRDVNQSLHALGDASTSLSRVAHTVHAHDAQLSGIIDSSQRVSQSLQDSPLAAQIRDTDAVLTGLASVDSSLGQGVDHTSAVLSDLDMILNGNTGNLNYTLRHAPRLAAQLHTLFGQGSTLLKGVNPALPALMTALVEAESAFGGTDANGHFVRVMAVLGTCTAGLNVGCSGYAGKNGNSPSGASGSSPGPGKKISDRGLENLLFGSH